METLRSIALAAVPGSQIVFDYLDIDAFDPAKGLICPISRRPGLTCGRG